MDKSLRPKIKVKREPVDWAIEVTGFVAVLLLFVLPAYFYKDLPENIPIHYGFDGTPDSVKSKATVWMMPVIGLILYIGLAVLNRYPHVFNYPVEITHENAEIQYKKASRLLRLLNTIIVVSFCYITYSTILTASGESNGIGNYFIPVFVVLIFGVMGVYLFQSSKKIPE